MENKLSERLRSVESPLFLVDQDGTGYMAVPDDLLFFRWCYLVWSDEVKHGGDTIGIQTNKRNGSHEHNIGSATSSALSSA
jgi:hypothetical protein